MRYDIQYIIETKTKEEFYNNVEKLNREFTQYDFSMIDKLVLIEDFEYQRIEPNNAFSPEINVINIIVDINKIKRVNRYNRMLFKELYISNGF